MNSCKSCERHIHILELHRSWCVQDLSSRDPPLVCAFKFLQLMKQYTWLAIEAPS